MMQILSPGATPNEIIPSPAARELSPKSLHEILRHMPSFFSLMATRSPRCSTRVQNKVDNVVKTSVLVFISVSLTLARIHRYHREVNAITFSFSSVAAHELLRLSAQDKIP